MGKGGGCVPSKKESTRPKKTARGRGASTAGEGDEIALLSAGNDPVPAPPLPSKANVRIVIVFYSMYGHVETLAKRMKLGADSVKGVEAVLYRVPETLPDDVLVQMKAPPKDETIPVIESLDELVGADGLLFGFPTRFGSMAAQMKSFFDSLGGLWMEQKLAGKPAGFFVSTGTQGGGQETTAWTAITQLAHHGMLYVPIGYKFGPRMMTKTDAVRGGSPYGAGVFVGDGTRETSETELALAKLHGRYMAFIVHRLASSRLI